MFGVKDKKKNKKKSHYLGIWEGENKAVKVEKPNNLNEMTAVL